MFAQRLLDLIPQLRQSHKICAYMYLTQRLALPPFFLSRDQRSYFYSIPPSATQGKKIIDAQILCLEIIHHHTETRRPYLQA